MTTGAEGLRSVPYGPVLAWLLFPLVGALAGLLAGLLGVGGGMVVVPALLHVFMAIEVAPEHRMRLALGTSLAAIFFTGFASQRAHHRRGAVDWGLVRGLVPGIVVGTFVGAWLAGLVPARALELLFIGFLLIVCARMLRRPSSPPRSGAESHWGEQLLAGTVIGAVSGLVGIGGGSLTVPYLSRVGLAIHRAVGTSAAVGVPIAIVGTLGYLLTGLGREGLPPYALGYVYLPALVGVAAVSVPMAPLGARLAHWLPVSKLRRAFAVFLLLVAGRMLFEQVLAAGVG